MKKYFLSLLAVCICLSALQTVKAQAVLAVPLLPSIPGKSFNIRTYGAVADNATDNSIAIQNTINAATAAGGGKVIVPAGVFICGPLQFANNLCLQLDKDAVLKFLPIDKYPGGTTTGTDFISGIKLHDVAITGKGTIDGQGSPWWPFAKDNTAKRPRMIALKDCDKILIEDVTLMNSPKFHIAISGKSSNVTVSGIIVRAPASNDPVNPSHNTDACDVAGRDILIKNCDISTGDDNFTCGGGTTNVHIIHCKYGNGHGLSIGSYTKGGVSNFLIEDCSFTNTDYGIRIKSDRDRGGLVQNITYRNLKMTNVGMPILIYASYNAKEKEYRNLQKITAEIAGTYPSSVVTETTPIYSNITFDHITATVQKGKRAGLLWGLPEAAVSNITFKDVIISAENPFAIFFAKNIQLQNCKIVTNDGINKLDISNAEVFVDGKETK
ncbi:MAG: glycosyl hydrolase family 28 protein [Ferruginibacter sp.]